MGYHHEALMQTLHCMANAGVELGELAFREKDYLAIAHEIGLHDPKARMRAARIHQKTYLSSALGDTTTTDKIVNIQVPDSFMFQGPTGAVQIRNVDAVPYVVTSASDQQLREECARRGWRSAITEATDDQLRAECERRGMLLWSEETRATHARVIDERDEWRARAESRSEGTIPIGKSFAEQMQRLMPDDVGAFSDIQFKARVDELLAAEKTAKASAPPFSYKDALMALRFVPEKPDEYGPGIASLPPRPTSEPLAHLDVDLLCDDE